MTEQDILRFSQLCSEEEFNETISKHDSIGIYREKRLHRILKRWVCEKEECLETPIGRYVADIYENQMITEIQTGSFYPLRPKLKYYLEYTDYHITLIHPIIAEKTLFRMNRESGELLSRRRSPRPKHLQDVLPELFWLSELLPSPRLTVKILFIRADEYQYSERMRYRKEGAYDAELYPRELLEEVVLTDQSDYLCFLPDDLDTFTAAEYAFRTKLKGKKLYSCLNFLCSIGLLTREKEGKKYRYFRTACSEGENY